MTAEGPNEALLARIRALGAVFVDAYVVVDAERRLIDFNPHYRAFFSRAQARRLKGSTCCAFMRLGVCAGDTCLARRCLEAGENVRYDEIPAEIEGEAAPRQVIASAAPVGEPSEGGPVALILLRDVSDAAGVQRKYQDMLERETRQKEKLREEIARKTKELVDTNQQLNRVQKELLTLRKGLFG